jgi:tape measure domain-containing protein
LASFADLTAKLNLNIKGFATALNTAAGKLNKFAKDMSGAINDGLTEPAKKASFAFKDVSRIIQGILVSQAFYSGLRSIKEATSATWDFASSLEYAQIAYSNLFGDTKLATEFINVLKDFAAVTPFGFAEAEKAAKRLLAYGIEYKNVMYVMQGVLSASTMSGNAQTIEAVSRALGQINTKGRLYNEEIRQLTEAGIPAYEILQEKLGLTQDQLSNLAKNAVPASIAINALVDGINERFGGMAQVSNLTMSGLFANLKDNLLMIGSEAIQPLFNRVKALLVPFVEFVTELRNIVETKGLGGLFERLFPPEMHSTIRMFIANLMNLWTVLKIKLANAFKVFKILLEAVIRVFNAFAPVITAVLDVIARLVKVILNNEKAVRFLTAALAACAAMWVIFKVKAIASVVIVSVVNLISKAVMGLFAALNFIVAHPFWALMIGMVGLVVGLSGGFNKLGEAVNGFFKKLTQFNGVDPDKILLPSQKERAADLEKFNNRLSDTGDAMDELADKTGKATKAAKGLLSFDEVFKLNEPDEGTNKGAIDWGDFDIPDFGGMGEALIPEIPSFDDFSTDFVDNLLKALRGKKQLLSTGIGAVIGAAIGGLIGGPLGAKIGAVAGAIAGWFWPKIAEALGLTDVGTIAVPIAAGLGAAIGFVAGGPLGAVVGTAIGALVGWIIDKIAKGLETGDWTGVGTPIGIGLGAGIGMIVGGPAGAAIGTAIGLVVGKVVDLFIDGFTNGNWDVGGIAMGLGTLIGAGIGMIAGGPAGALIGAAIGALVGWIVDLIEDNWDAIANWFRNVGKWFEGLFIAIGTFFVSVGNAIEKFFSDIWDKFSTWVTNICNKISTWFTDIRESVSGFFSDIWEAVSGFFSDIWDKFSTWISDVWDKLTDWVSDVVSKVATFFSDIWDKLTDWIEQVITKIGNFFSSIWNSITSWFTKFFDKVSGLFSDIVEDIAGFISDVTTKFTDFFSDLWTDVKEGVANIYNTFKDWITDMWDNVFGKFFGWISDGITKLREFFGLDSKAKSIDTSYADVAPEPAPMAGHALGGIFRREHVARFAEGNKAEAVIPLENYDAMQPFVTAISDGIMQGLMPTIASMIRSNNGPAGTVDNESLRPLYVGTLIADERGLKELYRKMNVIEMSENKRRGR